MGRAVQTFKLVLKKQRGGSLDTRVARFLVNYRSIPHTATGVSPAELLLKCPMRTHLNLLRKDFRRGKVERYQWAQKGRYDQHARPRSFQEGDKVYVSGVSRLAGGPKWLPDSVTTCQGTACIVTLEDGGMLRRHNDHIRHRSLDIAASPEPAVVPEPRCESWEATPELGSTSSSRLQPRLGEADDKHEPLTEAAFAASVPSEAPTSSEHSDQSAMTTSVSTPLRRSCRISRKPDRYRY